MFIAEQAGFVSLCARYKSSVNLAVLVEEVVAGLLCWERYRHGPKLLVPDPGSPGGQSGVSFVPSSMQQFTGKPGQYAFRWSSLLLCTGKQNRNC